MKTLNFERLNELAKTDADLDGLLAGLFVESDNAPGDDPAEYEQAIYDHIEKKKYADCSEIECARCEGTGFIQIPYNEPFECPNCEGRGK